MKLVLWVSRHEMTPEQKADLDRIMGESVELIVFRTASVYPAGTGGSRRTAARTASGPVGPCRRETAAARHCPQRADR